MIKESQSASSTWYHGTQSPNHHSILQNGLKNGVKNLEESVARNPLTSLAPWFGGGENGVLLGLHLEDSQVASIGENPYILKRENGFSSSEDKLFPPETIIFYIFSDDIKKVLFDVRRAIRNSYSTKEHLSKEYVSDLSEILFKSARKKNDEHLSREEAAWCALELCQNIVEMTFITDLRQLLESVDSLQHILEPTKIERVLSLLGSPYAWSIDENENGNISFLGKTREVLSPYAELFHPAYTIATFIVAYSRLFPMQIIDILSNPTYTAKLLEVQKEADAFIKDYLSVYI